MAKPRGVGSWERSVEAVLCTRHGLMEQKWLSREGLEVGRDRLKLYCAGDVSTHLSLVS